MDSCFICLENTNIKPCSHCNLRAHRTCWRDYISMSYKTKFENVSCPICSRNIEQKRHMTRSVTRAEQQRSTLEIVRHIKGLITLSSNTIGCHNKMEIARELFEYMSNNMKFLHKYPDFDKTVRNKMIEFVNINKWNYPKNMYMKMFGEEIPTEYF